jgi:hypothetical protein
MKNKISNIPLRLTVTVLLAVMAGWLLQYTWTLRKIHYKTFSYSEKENRQLQDFPRAQYEYGQHAWFRSDARAAAHYYRRAVTDDPLFIDAWIALAQAEQALGNSYAAGKTLAFVNGLTRDVRRWKWPQTLLANELGMEKILVENVNYLVAHGQKLNDAFYMTDVYFKGQVKAVLTVLDDAGKTAYLNWLMRFKRVADAMTVWGNMAPRHLFDDPLLSRYVHFLLHNGKICEAGRVWQQHTDIIGMTNAGFEDDSPKRGFDWRYNDKSDDLWRIRRVTSAQSEGLSALKVRFGGLENVNFHHLYQIVPVLPDTMYQLTFQGKTRNLTTDQRPFIEVYSFQTRGLYQKSEMLPEHQDWHTSRLEFTTPADCNAVVVRLRRMKSGRFDCNIKGTVWLDHFTLVKAGKNQG